MNTVIKILTGKEIYELPYFKYSFIFMFKLLPFFLKRTEEFDTTIQGPWMKKWDIVHVNQHVGSLTPNTEFTTSRAVKA